MNEKIQKIVIHRLRVCQATFSFQNRPDKPSGGLINPKGVGGKAGKYAKQGGLISVRAANCAIPICYYPWISNERPA